MRRGCCIPNQAACLKSRHLRALKEVSTTEVPRIVVQLGMCDNGLNREEFIRAGVTLANRNIPATALEFVDTMRERGMPPSLKLHNELMMAYARNHRWDQAMNLLLRMQQDPLLQPNEQTFTAAIRAGARSPGGGQFAEMLRPQLEAAARREAEARGLRVPDSKSLPLGTRAAEATTVHDNFMADAGASSSSEAARRPSAGLTNLLKEIAEGTQMPTAQLYFRALDGCLHAQKKQRNSARERWKEAMQITSMMELWVREVREARPPFRAGIPNRYQGWVEYPRTADEWVTRAYRTAIRTCKGGPPGSALDLIVRLEKLGVPKEVEFFNAAITACASHRDLDGARHLVERVRQEGLVPDLVTYNALLGVMRTVGGQGEQALGLLDTMRDEGIKPDGITYMNVLSAARPTFDQARLLRTQAQERRGMRASRLPLAPAAPAAAATVAAEELAGAASALADGGNSSRMSAAAALDSSAVGSSSSSSSDGVRVWGGDTEVATGPLGVYRRALELLEVMPLRGVALNRQHFAVALEMSSRSSDYDQTEELFLRLPREGLVPDKFCLLPFFKAASFAGETRVRTATAAMPAPWEMALRVLNETEAAVARDHANVDGSLQSRAQVELLGERGLKLFTGGNQKKGQEGSMEARVSHIRTAELGDDASLTDERQAWYENSITAADRQDYYNFTVGACNRGNAPLPAALALVPLMRARGVPANRFTFAQAVHTCKRSDGWREALRLLQEARASGVTPLNVDVLTALVTFKGSTDRAGVAPPWMHTVQLIDEAVELAVNLPAEARLHLLSLGRLAGAGWEAVRQADRLEFDEAGAFRPQRDQFMSQHGRSGERVRDHAARAALEVQVQGELFCLAAQDGDAREYLDAYIGKLRRDGSAPAPKLLERALHACHMGRDTRASWRNVPLLIKLADLEKVDLTEPALVHLLHAYEPTRASSAGDELSSLSRTELQALAKEHGVKANTSTRKLVEELRATLPISADVQSADVQPVDEAMLIRLADTFRVGELSPDARRHIMRLCRNAPAAAEHVRRILAHRSDDIKSAEHERYQQRVAAKTAKASEAAKAEGTFSTADEPPVDTIPRKHRSARREMSSRQDSDSKRSVGQSHRSPAQARPYELGGASVVEDGRVTEAAGMQLHLVEEGLAAKKSTSGYLGVSRMRGRFRANHLLNGKRTDLGSFDTAVDAAVAYAKHVQHLQYADDNKEMSNGYHRVNGANGVREEDGVRGLNGVNGAGDINGAPRVDTDEEAITPTQGAGICNLIGRIAADETMKAAAAVRQAGGRGDRAI